MYLNEVRFCILLSMEDLEVILLFVAVYLSQIFKREMSYDDVLQRRVNDLVVVRDAVELVCGEVQEHMVRILHTVCVGMGLVPTTWRIETHIISSQ